MYDMRIVVPRSLITTLAIVATIDGVAQADVTIYVDDDASAGGSGMSWATPMKHLQDALSFASVPANTVTEIHVAQGVYLPDRNSSAPSGSGDREATFQLVSGVALKGGYAGIETENPAARSISAFETILDGDLLDNDYPPYYFNHGENSYHVVSGSGTDASAILDGCTIQSGYADGYDEQGQGAGLFNNEGSPTIRNCKFLDNTSELRGGAIANTWSSSPTIENCTFATNASEAGGAVANFLFSNPTISNCGFVGNFTLSGLNPGGAIFNTASCNPAIVRCVFIENQAAQGGAIAAINACSPSITNCIFVGNLAAVHGGAVYAEMTSHPVVSNCVFDSNASEQFGGALYAVDVDPHVINSTFSGNSAASNGGAIVCIGSSSEALVTSCILWGNSPNQVFDSTNAETSVSSSTIQGGWAGAGSNNSSSNPDFVDAVVGNLRLAASSSCIDTGADGALPPDVVTDADDNPRFVNDVDKGAYEHQGGSPPIMDCNNNNIDDPLDIATRLSSDCNANGVPDECDLESGAATDENGNGILDECEDVGGNGCPADVDDDGVVGATDLIQLLASWGADGSSPLDLNGDGIVGIGDLSILLAAWGPCE